MHSHLFRAKEKARKSCGIAQNIRERRRGPERPAMQGGWGAPETSVFWQIFPFLGRRTKKKPSLRQEKWSFSVGPLWSGCKSPKVVFFSAEEKREKGNGVYDFYETVHPREGEGIEKEEGRGEGGNVCRPQKRGMSRNEDEGRKKGEEEGLLGLLLWTCMVSASWGPLENEMSEKEKSRLDIL